MKNVALLVSAIACVNQVIATELTVNIEDLINNRVNDSTKEFGKYVQIELKSEHTGQIACKSPSITIVPKEPIENPLNVRFTIPSIIKNDNSQHQYYRIRPGSKKFRNFAVPNLFFHIIFEEVNGAKFILDEDCSFMFENKTDMPSSIKYIDFRAMDTTNVTNMHGMFYGCDNLEYMDVSKFNTSNVTDGESESGSSSSF